MGHPRPVRGWRRRRYLTSATEEGGESIKRCAGVASGNRALTNTASKRKRKRKRDTPELFDEIVWEILIRLPVKSLVRFRSVSKAWRAIISDPSFRRRRATAKALSTNIRFYQWHLKKETWSTATLVYGRHFPAGEFGTVSQMVHCDGLVLLSTNTKAYVFNPATRDAIALPESKRNALSLHDTCLPIGLGMDASTGRYKVARAFYRPSDDDPMRMAAMGMEVFTIGGEDGSWREILEDPPYLMASFWQAAAHCKGCLFYFIDKKNHQNPPQGLIRFNLQDETFGITPLIPDLLPQVEDDDIALSELDGELCACFFSKWLQRLMIFTTGHILDRSDDAHWRCRYVIDLPECHPMALHGSGGILMRLGHCLFRYDLGAHGIQGKDDFHWMDRLKYVGLRCRGRAWKNLCFFNLISYTESLVPLNAKASSQALQ
nr:putative F-box protein At2g02030 isoform X2 [Setaria viridis]